MTQIYFDDDITIERIKPSCYRLRNGNAEMFLNVNRVTDQNGSEIMTFRPKEEMWWDVKLILNKKLPIGICSCQRGPIPVTVRGVLQQDLIYADAHILSRKGITISRGPDFDLKSIEHCALFLIMVKYHDQRS